MKKSLFVILIVAVLGVLLLSACSAKAENRSEIPPFPRLKADSGKFEEARRKMVNIEKTALPDKTIEIAAYTTDAPYEEVLTYYKQALKGWTNNGSSDQNGITIVKWNTGKTKGFSLYYSHNPSGSNNIVLLEQFWK